jgi:hypothetical protein
MAENHIKPSSSRRFSTGPVDPLDARDPAI